MSEPKSGLSRRTVLKGAAWSVPVVAVATAVPMAAASGEVIIGPFEESSANITNQTVSMSGFFVPCDGISNETDWKGDTFTATITITYVGTNSDFTFEPATVTSPWQMTVTPTQITLTTSTVANGCGPGSFQFPAIYLTFNQNGIDPGPDSIEVTGSAVNEDGTFMVSPLIDVTPCSPTFGESPIVGPRDIPSPCNE